MGLFGYVGEKVGEYVGDKYGEHKGEESYNKKSFYK